MSSSLGIRSSIRVSGATVNRSVLRRKCSCGGKATADGNCDECREKHESELGIQKKLKIGASNHALEHEADRMADLVLRQPGPQPSLGINASGGSTNPRIQRRSTTAAGPASLSGDAASVVSQAGTASPLPAGVRSEFENRFGHDFSHVRIHTGDRAAKSAESFQAKAYTLGSHVVFGAGNYNPVTTSGRQLLAHELTHVVQQCGDLGSTSLSTQTFSQAAVQRKAADVESEPKELSNSSGENVGLGGEEVSESDAEFRPEWLGEAVELLTKYGAEIGEIGIGFVPVVGDLYDVVTAILGETLISREKLDPLDRVLAIAGLIPIPGVSGKVLRMGRSAIEWALKRLNVNPVAILNRALQRSKDLVASLWQRANSIVSKSPQHHALPSEMSPGTGPSRLENVLEDKPHTSATAKSSRPPETDFESGQHHANSSIGDEPQVRKVGEFIESVYSKSFQGVPTSTRSTSLGKSIDKKLRSVFRDDHSVSGKWDAGHLFPAQWGNALGETVQEAAGDVKNLTVQARSMNRGKSYRDFEKSVAEYLAKNPDAKLDISIKIRTRAGDNVPISRSIEIRDARGSVPAELEAFVTNVDTGKLYFMNAFKEQIGPK